MPNFPGGFDNDSSLYLAVNNLLTSLTSAISDSTLVIPVLTTSGFPSTGFITITTDLTDPTSPEAVAYSGTDASNFYATERGADGTQAKTHTSNSRVGLNVVAAHHNILKDTLIELEYFVGISGSESFVPQDDLGNVDITGLLIGDIVDFQQLTSVSGTFDFGSFSTELTVSGEPVLIGDQPQYVLVDGTRGFTGPVSGVPPIASYDLVTEGYLTDVSGTLSAEIDSDIAIHTADSSAHHTRYSRAENDAILGSDGITIASGTNSITVASFHGEFVLASSTLNTAIQAVSDALPVRDDLDFTSLVVDRAGGERNINQTFNSRSLIRKLKVTPTTVGVNSYVIQFFTKDTFSYDDLLEYEATASGTYVDNQLWFHEDEDGTGEIHLKITNTSLYDSTFHIEMKSEKFA